MAVEKNRMVGTLSHAYSSPPKEMPVMRPVVASVLRRVPRWSNVRRRGRRGGVGLDGEERGSRGGI